MATHWSDLEVAEFFIKGEEMRGAFLWLQGQSKRAMLDISPHRI